MSVNVEQKKLFTDAFECFVSGITLKEIRTAIDFDRVVTELVDERQIPLNIVHAALASVRSHMHLKGIWKQYVFAMQNVEQEFLDSWLEDDAMTRIEKVIKERKNAPSKEETQAAKLREQGTPKLSVI